MPIPVVPPASWFQDPKLERLTPLTILDTGRILGHLAGWNICHTGYADRCVTCPTSKSGYAYFMLGSVETDDGPRPCGQITMHTGHAAMRDTASQAKAHYDDTSVAAADVAAGEDTYGVWLAGALRPSISDEDRRALSAAKLSGDWRSVDGHLELLAALAVNVPGFPVPHAAARVASGEAVALVAAGQRVVAAPSRDVEARMAALHARAVGGMDALHRLARGT